MGIVCEPWQYIRGERYNLLSTEFRIIMSVLMLFKKQKQKTEKELRERGDFCGNIKHKFMSHYRLMLWDYLNLMILESEQSGYHILIFIIDIGRRILFIGDVRVLCRFQILATIKLTHYA